MNHHLIDFFKCNSSSRYRMMCVSNLLKVIWCDIMGAINLGGTLSQRGFIRSDVVRGQQPSFPTHSSLIPVRLQDAHQTMLVSFYRISLLNFFNSPIVRKLI